MADEDNRYRSLTAPGMGAEAASEVILRTLADRPGLHVREIGPGRISVSRTHRPAWALVLCACTLWLGGLGLLFLLVKRTDAGDVTVTDGPRGCVVALPPLLAGPGATALQAALAATGTTGGAAFAATPAPASVREEPDDDLEGRTVARCDLRVPAAAPSNPPGAAPQDLIAVGRAGARAAGPAPSRGRVVLRFDAGEVAMEPGACVVLGRDPSPKGRAHGQVVPGDASSVSKAHLLVDFDGTTVIVEDLRSTNGSTLVRDGDTRRLEPGVPVPLVDGDRVALGTLSFAIDVTAGRPGDQWS